MKHHFVIEADTEMYSVFVREVMQEFTEIGIQYVCDSDAEILALDPPSPEFYGKLDALLITRGKIEKAAPIIPIREEPICQPTPEL